MSERFHQLQQERRHRKSHWKFLRNVATFLVLQLGLTLKCRLTWIQLREMSFLLSPNRHHPAGCPHPGRLCSLEILVDGRLCRSPRGSRPCKQSPVSPNYRRWKDVDADSGLSQRVTVHSY